MGWRGGPGGLGDAYFAVDDGDLPVAGVEVAVVTAAEQNEVVYGGFAAVDPGFEVVSVAADRWCAADYATFVAVVEGFAHAGGDEADGAADV